MGSDQSPYLSRLCPHQYPAAALSHPYDRYTRTITGLSSHSKETQYYHYRGTTSCNRNTITIKNHFLQQDSQHHSPIHSVTHVIPDARHCHGLCHESGSHSGPWHLRHAPYGYAVICRKPSNPTTAVTPLWRTYSLSPLTLTWILPCPSSTFAVSVWPLVPASMRAVRPF